MGASRSPRLPLLAIAHPPPFVGYSLAGIRVVKAYRAERREGAVFANGVQRLLPGSVSAGHWISRANPTS
jgi:hypothetical protein